MNTSGSVRHSSVRTMTPTRSGDIELESREGSLGSKFAERDDDSKDWVRSSSAHRAANDTQQALANICLKLFLYGRYLLPVVKAE